MFLLSVRCLILTIEAITIHISSVMKDAVLVTGLITSSLVSANYATHLLTPLRHSRGKVFYLSTTLIKSRRITHSERLVTIAGDQCCVKERVVCNISVRLLCKTLSSQLNVKIHTFKILLV